MDTPKLEGNIVKRTLQFFWLVDYSGSMSGSKIATLNHAIKEAVPEVQKSLQAHPEVQVMMRAIKFADRADWHIGPTAAAIENFVWHELGVDGTTATASAINMLSDELEIDKMDKRGYPPVCILLSDGYCTESTVDYDKAIKRIDDLPWGKKAIRLVIAIGNESDYDEVSLLKFVNQKEVGVLKADTPGKLVQYIKWASVTASISSSKSRSSTDPNKLGSNVNMGTPPQSIQITNSTDVF